MNVIKFLSAAMIAAVFAAPAARAKDDAGVLPSGDAVFVKWGEAEGWTIYVDGARNTCLIERVDPAENVIQMGLTQDHGHAYVGIFTKADIGIESGTEKVFVALHDAIYEGEATKLTRHLPDGYSGGYVLTNSPDFVKDVQKSYEMILFPEKDYALVVDLTGSLKAIDAARACNRELNP